MLEKTLQSPLNCKKIQPVHPKGNQSWIFIGRTDAEAETPILWPPDAKNWLIGKEPDAGKDWRRKEEGTTKLRWLNGVTDSMDTWLSKLWELVIVRCAVVPGVAKSWTQLRDWTELKRARHEFIVIIELYALHRFYRFNWLVSRENNPFDQFWTI